MLNPKKEAQELLRRLKLQTPPIPVELVAKMLGATVVSEDMGDDSLCGMVFKRGAQTIIGVNSAHHPNRQRFTIAHEIGHLVLHSNILETGKAHFDRTFGVQLNRDKRSSRGDDWLEVQANQFAAELLMPSSVLIDELKGEYVDIESDSEVKKLADKYGVSQQAMSIKLLKTFPEDF